MDKKKIKTVEHIIRDTITVTVPGSKSITNRALLLATLAEGKSVLKGVLFSDDSRHFLECIKSLGFETKTEEDTKQITVTGLGGRLPKTEAEIYVGSAGTAARFLAAYLGCSEGTFFVDASEQMRKRPMKPLLEALEHIGAEVVCLEEDGHFPLRIVGHGICNQHMTVDIDQSSQFLSALLISGFLSTEDLHIHVEGSHGMAYIQMTIALMQQFGVCAKLISEREFVIKTGQEYQARNYQIEPDVSAACYFWAMAAVLGITVIVRDTHFDSLQGDVAFVKILETMGCIVEDTSNGIAVTGPTDGHLKGIDADMHTCSDQAITLAAIAPFADSPVHISGIGHIRLQESDRIAAITENLTALGLMVEEQEDAITIYPGKIHGAEIQTHDDHRLAMGFAITGLRCQNVTILNPMCCRKTFEDYFSVLEETVRQITK